MSDIHPTRKLINDMRQEYRRDMYRPVLIEELLAEGWSPPARQIETGEEWEAVPPGAVVVVTTRGHGRAWVRLDTGTWTNGPSCYATKTLLRAHGPRATVVWSPTEKAGTE